MNNLKYIFSRFIFLKGYEREKLRKSGIESEKLHIYKEEKIGLSSNNGLESNGCLRVDPMGSMISALKFCHQVTWKFMCILAFVTYSLEGRFSIHCKKLTLYR